VSLTEAQHAALMYLAELERLTPENGEQYYCGWVQTRAPTRNALERMGYVEPCDHHTRVWINVGLSHPSHRVLIGRVHHFQRLTEKGRRYVETALELREQLASAGRP
jgi:hypothetical protein